MHLQGRLPRQINCHDIRFPLHRWKRFVGQPKLTLNLMGVGGFRALYEGHAPLDVEIAPRGLQTSMLSSRPFKKSGWWQIASSPNYSQVSHVTVPCTYRYRFWFAGWSGSVVTRSGSHGGLV
jgi:hypothetical protein